MYLTEMGCEACDEFISLKDPVAGCWEHGIEISIDILPWNVRKILTAFLLLNKVSGTWRWLVS